MSNQYAYIYFSWTLVPVQCFIAIFATYNAAAQLNIYKNIMLVTHQKRPFKCNFCNEGFYTEGAQKVHMKMVLCKYKHQIMCFVCSSIYLKSDCHSDFKKKQDFAAVGKI